MQGEMWEFWLRVRAMCRVADGIAIKRDMDYIRELRVLVTRVKTLGLGVYWVKGSGSYIKVYYINVIYDPARKQRHLPHAE